MSNTAIKVENLSKRYRIGLKEEIHNTMVEAITDFVKRPLKNLRRLRRLSNFNENGNEPEDNIWALKDVSFEIKQGEVIGIIGRNGAGKSTLLKIISHITEPTSGSVTFNGRVSSLLEVGTGFHDELTGRENVYLNGTILGMSKIEIDRKFDEIVAFSEVEKFLDTPVKRYSSGMKVRLAFAVAAHLEPEILLIDEVLAVGDVAFQKKCMGKMEDVSQKGRTVLFVSHNMGAITNLCPRAILLTNGEKVADGNASAIVADYIASVSDTTGSSYVCQEKPNSQAWIASADLESADGVNCGTFLMSDPIVVKCVLNIMEKSKLTLSVQIKELNNSPIFHFTNGDTSFVLPSLPGSYRVRIRIPSLNLYPSKYIMRLALTDIVGGNQEEIEDISFRVEQDYSLCSRPLPRQAGLVFARPEWFGSSLDSLEK